MNKLRRLLCPFLIIIMVFALASCGDGGGSSFGGSDSGEVRDNTPKVLTPSADGDEVYSNGSIAVDASNSSEGYIMVRADGKDHLVRIMDPNGEEYKYYLKNGDYQPLPLSSGDGTYNIEIMESVGGNSYIMAYSASVSATIENEFSPFLYPNQYAYFTKDSSAVSKAKELAKGQHSDLDVIGAVYDYTTTTIVYDTEKAATVTAGYIPNVEDTMSSGKGICFDYASVMTSMLRSQGIPTKLEVGYSGEAYHAWISTYVDEIGWVDNVIQFDGESWSLMDPTLAASNDKDSVKKYVGDGSNYYVKYSY